MNSALNAVQLNKTFQEGRILTNTANLSDLPQKGLNTLQKIENEAFGWGQDLNGIVNNAITSGKEAYVKSLGLKQKRTKRYDKDNPARINKTKEELRR